MICHALTLARSSFYSAKTAKDKNDRLDKEIRDKIVILWKTLPGIGYRKISRYLKLGECKIRRILKEFRGDKKKCVKQKKDRKFPNLIIRITKDLIKNPLKQKRNNWIVKDGKNGYRKLIYPVRPYQLWAGDWKELKIPFIGLTLYIFIIIDCYTRKVMGWSFSIIKDGGAAVQASMMAVEKAKTDPLFDPKRLIMHTDQGSAYVSEEYIEYWKSIGVHISMADKGKPTQNPYIEAFNSILVRFWITKHEFLSVIDAQESITGFFNLYNTIWKHGSIGYMTPNEKLKSYRFENKRSNHISIQRNLCPKIDS